MKNQDHAARAARRIRTAPPSVLLALATLALAASTGACMVSVEAEIPDVEVTQHDLTFTGVPAASAFGDVAVTQTFSQKHDALDLPAGLTSEVKALEVTMTAKSRITDLSFVKYLRLTMSDNSNNDNAIDLINYERADNDGSPASPTLTMQAVNPVNALEKWKTNSALFTIEVAGTLPSEDWTADLTVHFAGKIQYQR